MIPALNPAYIAGAGNTRFGRLEGYGALELMAQAAQRAPPGARLPVHAHVMIEQTWVIEGSQVCGEGECKAGQYVWRPAGSRHEAWGGPQGGLMLAMFQIPNK